MKPTITVYRNDPVRANRRVRHGSMTRDRDG
jgi:hypothetical protein